MPIPVHTQTDPWRFALDSLEAGRRAVLVFVVDHSGSVPGVTGTRIVVSDSEFAGTIGGGAAEQQLLERAASHGGKPEIYQFLHTPSGGGTLCSGIQEFAIVALAEKDRGPINAIVGAIVVAGRAEGALRPASASPRSPWR